MSRKRYHGYACRKEIDAMFGWREVKGKERKGELGMRGRKFMLSTFCAVCWKENRRKGKD